MVQIKESPHKKEIGIYNNNIMKKETQEQKDIREDIVDWLSTHRLMQGEFEILKRYVRQFYDISLHDITEEALVSLWKNSGENEALRMGYYCMEDFWDWEEFEMMLELDDDEEEDEEEEEPTPPQTYPNFHKGETGIHIPQDNVLLTTPCTSDGMAEHNDVTTRETPFSYITSGIPPKLVLTYELNKFDRIQMEKTNKIRP